MFIFSCAHLTCSRLHRFFLRLLKLALVPLDILLMFWGQPLDLWSLGHHMRTRCRLLLDHFGGSKIERLLFDFEIWGRQPIFQRWEKWERWVLERWERWVFRKYFALELSRNPSFPSFETHLSHLFHFSHLYHFSHLFHFSHLSENPSFHNPSLV